MTSSGAKFPDWSFWASRMSMDAVCHNEFSSIWTPLGIRISTALLIAMPTVTPSIRLLWVYGVGIPVTVGAGADCVASPTGLIIDLSPRLTCGFPWKSSPRLMPMPPNLTSLPSSGLRSRENEVAETSTPSPDRLAL